MNESMTETLITYDTALLAKEKGFDINTYSDCWVKTLDGKIIHNKERENKPEHDRSKQFLMQPSQSLLQKWLREKYNIEIFVVAAFTGEDVHKYSYYVLCNCYDTDADGSEAKTYEEALEIALVEGLKLIENKDEVN